MLSFLFFFFSSKGTKVFCKLKLHVLRLENIAYNLAWSWVKLNHLSRNRAQEILCVTRDDSQRRFLLQHSVTMLEQYCDYSKQCRNNVATLCCAKNRRCESSRVTSPLVVQQRQRNPTEKRASSWTCSPCRVMFCFSIKNLKLPIARIFWLC